MEAKLRSVLTMHALLGKNVVKKMLDFLKSEMNTSELAGENTLEVKPGSTATMTNRNTKAFLSKLGFETERLAVAEHMPKLKSLEKHTPEQVDAFKYAMAKTAIWKLSLKGDAEEIDTSSLRTDTFDVSAKREGRTLMLAISGKLDTDSAQKLQTFFRQVQDTINRVEIDCRNMDSISPASVHLLIIMRRSCEQGVSLSALNDEILPNVMAAGLDMFLEINP